MYFIAKIISIFNKVRSKDKMPNLHLIPSKPSHIAPVLNWEVEKKMLQLSRVKDGRLPMCLISGTVSNSTSGCQ